MNSEHKPDVPRIASLDALQAGLDRAVADRPGSRGAKDTAPASAAPVTVVPGVPDTAEQRSWAPRRATPAEAAAAAPPTAGKIPEALAEDRLVSAEEFRAIHERLGKGPWEFPAPLVDAQPTGPDSAQSITAARQELDDVLHQLSEGAETPANLAILQERLASVAQRLSSLDFGRELVKAPQGSFTQEFMDAVGQALEELENTWRAQGLTDEQIAYLRRKHAGMERDLIAGLREPDSLMHDTENARRMTDPANINERAVAAPIELPVHLRIWDKELRKRGEAAFPWIGKRMDELVLRRMEEVLLSGLISEVTEIEIELGGDPAYNGAKIAALKGIFATLPWVERVEEVTQQGQTVRLSFATRPKTKFPQWIVHPYERLQGATEKVRPEGPEQAKEKGLLELGPEWEPQTEEEAAKVLLKIPRVLRTVNDELKEEYDRMEPGKRDPHTYRDLIYRLGAKLGITPETSSPEPETMLLDREANIMRHDVTEFLGKAVRGSPDETFREYLKLLREEGMDEVFAQWHRALEMRRYDDPVLLAPPKPLETR